MLTVIISSVILLICFYVLAILTEEYFVPAIDKISDKMKLSSDAAGATLLAMGSSAPEFFTSLFAVMGIIGGAHADVGAGAIVGSAIFNVLVIVGAAAMFKAVKLQWQPVIRDLIFYIVTILLLLAAFWDGNITVWEALGFVLMYGVYVFTVVKWRKWLKYEDVATPSEDANEKTRNILNRITHKLIGFVVPDPYKKPKLYQVSFIISILLIAAISFLLVQQITTIAHVLHINPTFLALTVLAAGTSLPDLVGSIVVAKQGRGDMAVSNAVGSNIFDILFGLGLPWLIVIAFMGKEVTVGTENLNSSIFLLFATVIAILFLLIVRKWKIGHKSGVFLIALYVAYCIYILLTVA